MRKRFLSTVLVLIMLLSLAPMSALADDTFRSGDFTFVIETGVACVKKYNGSSSSVSVPSKVDYDGVTYKVRNIHQDAFKNCTTIQKLVLPETVNRIGKQAFANCTSLNSITINGDLNGVHTVDNTFYNIGANSDYLNVTFGPEVTAIPSNLFDSTYSKSEGYYPHITSVTIPDSVTSIGLGAFNNCHDLKTVRLGSGVKSIGTNAFRNTAIQSLTIDGNCTVGKYAFLYCHSLKELTINGDCTLIEGCFAHCTGLESIKINGTIKDNIQSSISENPVLFIAPPFYNVGSNSDSLKVTFGKSVSVIPERLFATHSSKSEGTYARITEVDLPSSISSIGDYAFYNCHDLKVANYEGSPSEWINVPVGAGNEPLWSAHFNFGSSYSFYDVHPTDYCYDAVKWAVDNEITMGTTPTTFEPKKTCTRAQTVTFLWRAAGKPEPVGMSNPFYDVKRDDYYYKAVLWAVSEGITKGTTDTTFSPNATVSRAQTVTFLWRMANKPMISGNNPFYDVVKGDYFYDAVLWAAAMNITTGTTPTTFSPNDGCNRGQIVTFIYRYMGK